MSSLGDAFSWPFQDSGWLGKIVVQGLIFLIPVVGWISLYGWLLINVDNIRMGHREVAPAGFHLSRGIGLFGVELVYGVVVSIIPVILIAAGGSMQANGNGAGAALSAIGQLLNFAGSLFLAFLMPSIILATAAGGFSAGLNVAAVWAAATANPTNSVLAGLIVVVSSFIAGIGIVVCFVGLIFTIPYAQAVVAGAVAWFAAQRGPAQAATPPPAASPPAE